VTPTITLHVLGSGTALPSAGRDNIALAIDTPAGLWLIDCGGSVYHKLLRQGLDPLRLRGLFLSHDHTDHVYGLTALLFQLKLATRVWDWREDDPALHIYANAPTLATVRCALDAYRIDLQQPPVAWHELPQVEGHPFAEDDATAWFCTPVVHSRPTLSVKVALKATGFALVYSADTEPCESLVRLATGADLLLHECTVPEPFDGHSTPQQVGQTAARAGVQRLAIVHYDPELVLPVPETLAGIRKGGFTGEVLFAEDGMALPLDV